MRTAEERFWEKVDKSSDCWVWTGALSHLGYGKFWYRDKVQSAHRVAYQLFIGEIPKGMCICHTCDNRKCVNPKHLWLGTQKENIQDMWAKGRKTHVGTDGPGAKLCELDVLLIRELLPNHTQETIAEWFDVSRGAIGCISTGQNWSHLQRQTE